jgi:ATP-dependent helicase/nuclease subunit B
LPENGFYPSGSCFSEGAIAAKGKLFSVPLGEPFLPALAKAVLSGRLTGDKPPSPQDFPAITIFLPNQAARQALRLEFLRASPAGATFLPRLKVLGEEAGDFCEDMSEIVPHAPGNLEYKLILTKLALDAAAKLRVAGPRRAEPVYLNFTPAEAFATAESLIALFDEIETEGKDIGTLARLSTEMSAEREQISRKLLAAVALSLRKTLAAKGWVTPARRRNLLLEAESRRVASAAGPVIVAGSTGSIPATVALMRAVLRHPEGFVVLPGLDGEAAEEDWAALAAHPEHPQHGLSHLLNKLGAARSDVESLAPSVPPSFRVRLLTESLRPASSLEKWADFIAEEQAAPSRASEPGLSIIEAESPGEEAEAIAHMLREALEHPGRNAALVTPDGKLRARVAGLLARWGLGAEENSEDWRCGQLLAPLAKAAAGDDSLTLILLLKHLTGSSDRRAFRDICLLEAAALRQSWMAAEIAALPQALRRSRAALERGELRHPFYTRAAKEDWERAEARAARIAAAMAPLSRNGGKKLPLPGRIKAHLACLDALKDSAGSTAAAVAAFDAAASRLASFARQAADSEAALSLTLGDYAALLAAALPEGEADAAKPHPRLDLWNPFDARLRAADLIILGGLNEGSWPRKAGFSPWLSLAERKFLGVPPPERRLGQSAHDYMALACANRVVLTRSKRQDGAPARPSRWLLRLKTLAAGAGLDLHPDQPWLDWVRKRGEPERVRPCARPAPRPPLAARPRRLSVTAIENWLANPYAIYAQYILGLSELRGPGLDLDARDRGILVHRALNAFTRRHPSSLPEDIRAALMQAFDAEAGDLGEHPRLVAFWRPRFARFAAWFAETEPGRRQGTARVLSEAGGKFAIDAPGGPFTITARADRIDLTDSGRAAIFDYKTSVSAISTAMRRNAPQLALEGMLAAKGAFAGVPGQAPEALAFILAAGAEPGGEVRRLEGEVADLIEAVERGVTAQIARFDDPHSAYVSRARAMFGDKARFDAYAHLARVNEWQPAAQEAA